LQILRSLGAEDTYYAFDFADKLKDFSDDLQARDFGIKCKVSMFGNSNKEWDSYSWNLSNMIFQMRQSYQRGIFDAVYLDGAHSFFHDGLATCLLKELIKDGGILILDDVFWKFDNHDAAYKENILAKKLTEEQIKDLQILRVQELFLTNDPNWEKLSPPNSWRSVFRKCVSK